MSSVKITILFTTVLLALSSLHCEAAPSPSAPAPEDPELLNSVFAYHGFVSDARSTFQGDLENGDESGAAHVLDNNIAPAYSTGKLPLSVDFISNLAIAAAVDLTQTIGQNNMTINKQVYEKTFAQLPEIASTNRSTLVQGFAAAVAQTMLDQQSAGNMGPDLSGPLLALAYAAGLDDVFEVVFSAAKAKGTSAADTGVLLSNLGGYGQPDLPAAATAAAIGVYGLSAANLAQAQGNTSAIGALLLGSASLEGYSPAAAQNLSNSARAANLQSQQQEVFEQAILQAVQHLQTDANPSLNATAVLIDAAIIAQNAAAVSEAFSQATKTPLQLFCQVQVAAAALSSTAGQAASSAIPSAFGSNPCAQASNYLQTRSFTGPQTSCAAVASSTYGPTATGNPSKSDCLAAASQLQGKGSTSCVVPNATVSSPLSEYLTINSGSLARSGSCQIIIGGAAGDSLPCSQAASYANDLAAVCSNTHTTTGAVFYPSGFHFINSVFVALTT